MSKSSRDVGVGEQGSGNSESSEEIFGEDGSNETCVIDSGCGDVIHGGSSTMGTDGAVSLATWAKSSSSNSHKVTIITISYKTQVGADFNVIHMPNFLGKRVAKKYGFCSTIYKFISTMFLL